MNKIKTKKIATSCLILQHLILLCVASFYSAQIYAEDVQQRGDAYVIYLPGNLNFEDVVSSVKGEVLGENWQVVHELDIGASVKEYDKNTENKVISVCKTQYLAKAIEEDPFISLIIPCRFTVFHESVEGSDEGKIVVGFYDPVAEAKGLDLKQAQAAEIATNELKAVLQRVADLYK